MKLYQNRIQIHDKCQSLFVWFDSLRPINNLSVKQGRVFLGWTSTKLGQMCLAQGPQRSDACEARTCGPSVSSQALYHWATVLPIKARVRDSQEVVVVVVIVVVHVGLWCHRKSTGPCSAVSNVSGYRCVSDCRSRGREFDPGPDPYFRGDWSWNNFYGHSPPFRWFIQEGLLSVTSESMCTNYWLTACSSLPRKKCG